jgi:biopolymer transport protein ExbD
MRRQRHRAKQDAELDITAFMNLMIVLVPILLLGMVFSRITVVGIVLPETATHTEQANEQARLELVIRSSGMHVNYPQGVLLRQIPLNNQGEQDFAMLTLVLQEVKRQLDERAVDQRAITLLAEQTVDYQTLIRTMDTVRSFKAVVAASVVDAALFPEISLGEAPDANAAAALTEAMAEGSTAMASL